MNYDTQLAEGTCVTSTRPLAPYHRVASRLLSIAVASSLASCATQLTSEPAGGTVPDSSFGYYLPREVYSVTVTYQLVSCPSGTLTPLNLPVVRQTAVITATDIADTSEHYYITFRSMDSAWKNTAFQATLYPNQTLKSVGANIASQTAQIATNLVTGGQGIAKLAAAAAAGGAPTCSPDVMNLLSAARESSKDLSTYNLPKSPGHAGSALVGGTDRSAVADVGTRAVVPTLQVSAIFDPAKQSDVVQVAPSITDKSKWFTGLFQSVPAIASMLTTTIAIGPPQVVPSTKKPSSSPIDGVVYRDPIPEVIRVCATDNSAMCDTRIAPAVDSIPIIIASQSVSVPQLGPYVVMPLKNSGFDNNNLAIAFAPNGVPCATAYATQSQLYQISSIVGAFGSGGGGGSSGSGGGKGTGSSGGSSTGGGSSGGGGGNSGGAQQQNASNASTPSVSCSSQ